MLEAYLGGIGTWLRYILDILDMFKDILGICFEAWYIL
jgi:hypothetical protein